MSRAVLLNNTEHEGLKIDTRACGEYGDIVNRTLAFSTEFSELQKEFPILFHKDQEEDTYQAHVILGFDADENLFVNNDQWQCNYIPAIMARGPFLIGFQDQNIDGGVRKEPIILVDMDDPRVAVEEGAPVFLPQGGDSPYLDNVKRSLQIVHQGAALDKTLIASLEKMELLEPVSIEITLSNIKKITFQNYHTINEDKLAQLDGESLHNLNKLGVLKLVFSALSSLGNFNKLIKLKNKQEAMVK